MTSEQILSITKCGDLYPNDRKELRERYKKLAKEWHPDTNKNPDADKVFAKITELHSKALELLDKGTWEKTNYTMITKQNSNKKIAVNYDTMFEFELGVCYVTKTKIIYVLDNDKEKYYNNAINQIESLSYADKNMREIMSIVLPKIYDKFDSIDGKHVLVLSKTVDVYPLKDVYEYFDNKIEDKHVAWIISRLSNISCYLAYSNLVHNGININNCFISPKYHSVLLLGGWWYTTKQDEKMIGTTKDIFSIMNISSKEKKISSNITDLESIKLLGRQLLGESNCRKLSLNDEIPKPFIDFLITGSGKDSYEEFKKWDKSLTAAYGKRRFIKMQINNIYKNKGE